MPDVNTPIDNETQNASALISAAGPVRDTGWPVEAAHSTQRKYGSLSLLRSYLILDPLIWAYTVFFGVISLVAYFFRDRERVLHSFARAWTIGVMKIILSPVTVRGLEKINTSKTYVYAANHASALDIPVLYANLPFRFRIVFKKELLSYPIIGGYLKRSGQVCINQQAPTRSIADIRSAVKGLRAGIPLVIFPEGGRTPDGDVKPFLPGAFFMAIKAQVDIVPIALIGTFELLPMNTYHIKCRPLEMRVGAPISTAGLKAHDLEALSDKVKKAMEALYYQGQR